MKNEIKTLASQFLLASNPSEKSNILESAKLWFKGVELEGLSAARVLKALGVSYMGSVTSSPKTIKGEKLNYSTYIVYLTPSNLSGVQLCPNASEGCRAACLSTSGHAGIAERAFGKSNPIAISRLLKTWLVTFRREIAEKVIVHEIARAEKLAHKKGNRFAARLNGTSDIFWGPVFKSMPHIQFYDYTKNPVFVKLARSFSNWHLTFSYSGTNLDACEAAIAEGLNVAFPVVGKHQVAALVANKQGYSMDDTDLRFLDEGGPFGILTVKQTPGTAEGIAKGFLLSREKFKEVSSHLASFARA